MWSFLEQPYNVVCVWLLCEKWQCTCYIQESVLPIKGKLSGHLSVINLSSKNYLADISTECSSCHQDEVNMCEQTLLFIALSYIEDTHHWGSKVGKDCSSLPVSSSQQSSKQGLPFLHLSWSGPLRISSGCAGPPTPTAPVLCHGPAR